MGDNLVLALFAMGVMGCALMLWIFSGRIRRRRFFRLISPMHVRKEAKVASFEMLPHEIRKLALKLLRSRGTIKIVGWLLVHTVPFNLTGMCQDATGQIRGRSNQCSRRREENPNPQRGGTTPTNFARSLLPLLPGGEGRGGRRAETWVTLLYFIHC